MTIWESLLDALLDTLKLVPWLLVMHVLIEVFEYHAVSKVKLNKVLRGPLAPLIGGASGILPQCGFGVVAADLYSRRAIRIGTMIAVFIATSDEAIPIMIGAHSKEAFIKLGVLLGFKLVFALIAGYALNLIFRKQELGDMGEDVVVKGCHHHELGEHTHDDEEHTHEGHTHGEEHEHIHADEVVETAANEESAESIENAAGTDSEVAIETTEVVAPTENIDTPAPKKKKFDFKCFVLHPLLHTLTVSGYILAVNVLFAVVLFYVGEKRLMDFMAAAKFAQPFLAALVGLIPNCASSVILAQMFVEGHITLGAAFAGLSVNAGLGLAVLIRKNKPVKNTAFIALGLYAYSCVIGLLLTLIPL